MVLQVWEWDPETNRQVLLIDADPMMLANDPRLTQMIETLHGSPPSGGRGAKGKSITKEVIEFIGVIVVKLCEILIEVLL